MLPDRVRREGSRLRKHVQDVVRSIEEPKLREAALSYPNAGGKMLRPALAAMSCEAAGGEPTTADSLAASVELVHTFSLVHDDFMDRDQVRRGVDTVHVAHDDATAILAGDVLFSLAFETLDELPDRAAGLTVAGDVARTARTLCEGQRLDMDFEDRWPSVDEYERMVHKKTAVLFACATRNGARLAGADPHTVEALAHFGRALGTGFQVQDDLLDMVGDPEETGKPRGSDVRAGKKTYPVLEALERLEGSNRDALVSVLETDTEPADVDQALDRIEACGALDATRDRANGFFDEAADALTNLPGTAAREDLQSTLDWLRTRQH